MKTMKVYLFERGTNLKGNPSYWLDIDDEEDVDELVASGVITEYMKDRHDEDGFISGFFNSKDEAREKAKQMGWEITNDEQ